MRDLYQAFKEAYRIIRVTSGVVIMTAIHKSYFPEEVMCTSEFINARYGYDEVIYERWVYAKDLLPFNASYTRLARVLCSK